MVVHRSPHVRRRAEVWKPDHETIEARAEQRVVPVDRRAHISDPLIGADSPLGVADHLLEAEVGSRTLSSRAHPEREVPGKERLLLVGEQDGHEADQGDDHRRTAEPRDLDDTCQQRRPERDRDDHQAHVERLRGDEDDEQHDVGQRDDGEQPAIPRAPAAERGHGEQRKQEQESDRAEAREVLVDVHVRGGPRIVAPDRELAVGEHIADRRQGVPAGQIDETPQGLARRLWQRLRPGLDGSRLTEGTARIDGRLDVGRAAEDQHRDYEQRRSGGDESPRWPPAPHGCRNEKRQAGKCEEYGALGSDGETEGERSDDPVARP